MTWTILRSTDQVFSGMFLSWNICENFIMNGYWLVQILSLHQLMWSSAFFPLICWYGRLHLWSLSFEMALHTWNKPYLVLVNNLSYSLLNLLRIFFMYVRREFGLWSFLYHLYLVLLSGLCCDHSMNRSSSCVFPWRLSEE